MGLKTSGETMQSLNNSSRRCAHVSAIFSPPGFALPMVGTGREAIVFTARYVMQRGAKAEHTVGLILSRSRDIAFSRYRENAMSSGEGFPCLLKLWHDAC